MLDVTVRRPIAPADVDALRDLERVATEHDRHPSLGDSVWRDVKRPTAASGLVMAADGDDVVGALHFAPPENSHDDGLVLSMVVGPRARGGAVEEQLLTTALGHPAVDGQPLLLWVFGADHPAAGGPTEHLGFRVERELFEMRVPLPLADPPRWPDGITVRAFRAGRDEPAWLRVNNRAFVDDPDQRGWTEDTLAARTAEPWFDPDGFLLAWRDDDLAGFCWTRLHPPTPPDEPEPLGEIYVIGVDPDSRGIGLGRALVVGGLEHLWQRGATVGTLFVDAGNEPAVALYRKLGFAVTRVDRAYARDRR
jgi:mycothiol synthase